MKATFSHLEGSLGPGSGYGIDVPLDWNGRLVVFAHGYRSRLEHGYSDSPGPLRNRLLELGHAFAWSHCSENGCAVNPGTQRTHRLRRLFVRHWGRPGRTYLIGRSFGACMCQKLAEEHPRGYDGALLVAGALGGTRAEVDYISTLRIIFDYFYPDVLPGSLLQWPPGMDFSAVRPSIVAAISSNPAHLIALASVDQIPIEFTSFAELVDSVIQALEFQVVGLDGSLGRAHARLFDNSRTIYTGSLSRDLLADLNTRVARHPLPPDANRHLNMCCEPDGGLEIPVLTLHTSRDPVVPLFHEEHYRDLVDAAGSPFLAQRTIGRHGHDVFEAAELVSSFEDLVAWVENGIRPPSQDR